MRECQQELIRIFARRSATPHRRLGRHRDDAASHFPAHSPPARRRNPLRAQHKTPSRPGACCTIARNAFHSAVYLRRSRRRPRGPLSRRARPSPSPADVFAPAIANFSASTANCWEKLPHPRFNLDFAPVLDLAFESSRSVMSSRTVSAKPRENSFLCPRIPRRPAYRQRSGMRQTLPRPRRRQARQPSRTPGN